MLKLPIRKSDYNWKSNSRQTLQAAEKIIFKHQNWLVCLVISLEINFKSKEFMQNLEALNIIVGEDLNYKIPLKRQFQST